MPHSAQLSCPSRDQLIAFNRGALTEAECSSIASHLSGCSWCESALSRIGNEGDLLQARLREHSALDEMLAAPEYQEMEQAAKAIVPGEPRLPVDASEQTTTTGLDRKQIHAETVIMPGGGTPPADSSEDLQVDGDAELPDDRKWIGPYLVQELLGEGAFGVVYRAWDPHLERHVALKIPRIGPGRSAEHVESFLQEARSAAKLRHPGIVAVHDVDRDGAGCCYIAMEFVDGQSLRDWLDSHRPSVDECVRMLIDLADAVHYAVQQGFVHRDLKPSNILISDNGRAQIADFGLALHEDAQGRHAWEVAGTLAYMAPEQVRGESHRLDGRADIWSLGVIFYEMLTGRRPFRGEVELLRDEILHREPKPPRQTEDTVPLALQDICLRCLKKQAIERYSAGKDLADALRHWQTTQRPRTIWNRWWVAAGVLLAAVVSSLGVIGLRHVLLQESVSENSGMTVSQQAGAADSERESVQTTVPRGSIPETLDDAPPRVWIPLLSSPPVALVEPNETLNARWFHDMERRNVFIDSRQVTMLALGETSGDSFEVTTRIAKNAATGTCGLFWGYHESVLSSGQSGWVSQVITIRFSEDAGVIVQRELWETHLSGGSVSQNKRIFAAEEVPNSAGETVEISVTIEEELVHEVRWNDVSLERLSDRNERLADRRAKAGIAIGVDGQLGVLNYRGTTTFESAKILFLRRTRP